MEEKERRIKIKKVEKYNEIVSEEQSKVVLNTGLMASGAIIGIFGAVCYAMSTNNSEQVINSLAAELNVGAGVLGLTGTAFSLKRLIQSISKKTLYEKEIDDLNMELDLDEEEKSRGAK